MKTKQEYHPFTNEFHTLSADERRKILPQLKEKDKFKILDTAGYRGTKLNVLKAVFRLSENEFGGCYKSIDHIAEDCGGVSRNTVKSTLKQLVRAGALKAVYRHQDFDAPNHERTTLYTVNFEFVTAPKRKPAPADAHKRFQTKRSIKSELMKLVAQKKRAAAKLQTEIVDLELQISMMDEKGGRPENRLAGRPENRLAGRPENRLRGRPENRLGGGVENRLGGRPENWPQSNGVSEFLSENESEILSAESPDDSAFGRRNSTFLESKSQIQRLEAAFSMFQTEGLSVQPDASPSAPAPHSEAKVIPIGDSPKVNLSGEEMTRMLLEAMEGKRAHVL
jgi:DNA-binding transcriptional ArsR family regulator